MLLRSRALSVLAVFAFLVALERPSTSAASSLVQAKSFEQELLRDEAKLRLRHNLERLEALFEAAATKGPASERSEAEAGRVRAAELLARWSGRADDRARAAKLRSELSSAPKVAASSPPESSRPELRTPNSGAKAQSLAKPEIEVEEGRLLVILPGVDATKLKLLRRELLGKGTPRARMYFDLGPLVASNEALNSRPIEDARVKQLRLGQVDESTVRFVFDLETGVPSAEIEFDPAAGPAFVITKRESHPVAVAPSAPLTPPSAPPAPSERRIRMEREEVLAQKEALERLLEQIVEEPRAPLEVPETEEAGGPKTDEPALASESVQKAPAQKTEKGSSSDTSAEVTASLARSTREALKPRIESAVRIRRVVVDAGHGGKDVGAVGRRGTREKDVNLALALALGRKLEKELGVEVVYTRKKDSFVSLERRTQIANAANADLFISVHSNANRNRKIRGIETYYLNTTSSRYSNRLATRENRDMHDPALIGDDSPEETEQEEAPAPLPGGTMGRDLRLLLADLAMRSAAQESRRLAGYIQHTAIDQLRQPDRPLKDLGVKKALFFVLLGVRMPSVLVESGFLSHDEEEQQLADPKYRDQLAAAMAQGVRRYVEERNEIAARF